MSLRRRRLLRHVGPIERLWVTSMSATTLILLLHSAVASWH